mmetsp:Transcript_52681/g.87897  ORF Transcript_52681/g.87897 Transcript_52681/m.87897 type:complete len:511 (-) Transcript_52681:91-1623(-)
MVLFEVAVRDKEECHHRLDSIADVKAATLELNDVALLDFLEALLSQSVQLVRRHLTDHRVEISLLVNVALGDQMVEFVNEHRDIGRHIRHPRQLLLRGLEITLQMQRHGHMLRLTSLVLLNGFHECVAPVQKSDFLTLGQQHHILLLQKHLGAVSHLLRPNCSILLVERALLMRDFSRPLHGYGNAELIHTRVPGRNGVNDFLVQVPNFLPFHRVGHLGHALHLDKFPKSIHVNPTSHQSPCGRHTGVVPAPNFAIIHKLRQLALGHDCVLHIQTREVIQTRHAKAEGLNHPLVLVVAVKVFRRPQGMRHAFKRIHDRARQIIRGIYLEFVPLPGMGRQIATEDHRVSEGLVGIVHGELGAQAICEALFRSFLHLFPLSQIFFNCVGTALRGSTIKPVLLHLFLGSVVTIRLVVLNHLLCHFKHLRKIVACVRWADVPSNAHPLQVLQNSFFILMLLFITVSVVEPQNHLPFVLLREHVVHERCFRVSNVNVSGSFRWEAGHHFAIFGIL